MTRTFSAPLRTVSPTDFEDLSEDSSTASEPELSPVRPPEAEVTEPERPCKRAKIMGRGVRFTENVRVQEYVAVPSDLPYQLQPKRFLEPEPVDDTVSAAAAFVEPERVKLEEESIPETTVPLKEHDGDDKSFKAMVGLVSAACIFNIVKDSTVVYYLRISECDRQTANEIIFNVIRRVGAIMAELNEDRPVHYAGGTKCPVGPARKHAVQSIVNELHKLARTRGMMKK